MEQGKNTRAEEFARFAKEIGYNYGAPGPNAEKGYNVLKIKLTADQIIERVLNGTVQQKRELSETFYNAGTLYTQLIEYYVGLCDFTYFAAATDFKANKTAKNIAKVLAFADNLKLSSQFAQILRRELICGAFYGVLCYDKASGFSYVLEFPYKEVVVLGEYAPGHKAFGVKSTFFTTKTEQELEVLLPILPAEMITQLTDPTNRIITVPSSATVAFEMPQGLPPILFSIIPFIDYLDRLRMDKKRLEQKLVLLLTQKLPLRNDGELIFSLDEAAELHRNLAGVLTQGGLANAVTTFGDIESVNTDTTASGVQPTSAESLKQVPINAGIISALWFPQSSRDVEFSVQKDSAYVLKLIERYNNWLLYQARFVEKSMTLKFLPITWVNKAAWLAETQSKFSFGWHKLLYAVGSGAKQSELLAQLELEKELDLANKLSPPQNSNTISGDIKAKPEEDVQTSAEE